MAVVNNQGFSAVELLITLFIASVFIIAGYQLWIQVVRAGTESDQLARASNVSYDYLRKNISSACPTSTTQPITIDGLSNTNVAITVTCPYTSIPALSSLRKIKSTVTYGSPEKEVSHVVLSN